MSNKAIVHMEGSTVKDGEFSMVIRTSGPLNEQITMVARYILQVARDLKKPPAELAGELVVEILEQMERGCVSINEMAIRDALDRANGQKE